MTHSDENPLNHPEVSQANWAGYVTNFVITVIIMSVALWVSHDTSVSTLDMIGWTSFLAFLAVIVQGYLILHMNWSRAQVWHTVAMVLFVPLFVVMIGLTMWMFNGLYNRVSISSPAHAQATLVQHAVRVPAMKKAM